MQFRCNIELLQSQYFHPRWACTKLTSWQFTEVLDKTRESYSWLQHYNRIQRAITTRSTIEVELARFDAKTSSPRWPMYRCTLYLIQVRLLHEECKRFLGSISSMGCRTVKVHPGLEILRLFHSVENTFHEFRTFNQEMPVSMAR